MEVVVVSGGRGGGVVVVSDVVVGTVASSFFAKWANPRLFLFIFVVLTSSFNYELKKHSCAWDSNPGPQGGNCRWIL